MLTYAGRARFVDRDGDAHTVTLEASGKESRGTGTASATVHAASYGENGQAGRNEQPGAQTRVTMSTTLNVAGRPAQMGRGVLADVGGKLVERFATNLSELPSADTTQGDAPHDNAAHEQTAAAQPPTAQPPTAQPTAGPAASHTAAQGGNVAAAAQGAPTSPATSGSPATPGSLATSDRSAPAASTSPSGSTSAASTPSGVSAPAGTALARKKEGETLDLLGVAAGPVARRAIPALGVMLAAILVLLSLRRTKRKNSP